MNTSIQRPATASLLLLALSSTALGQTSVKDGHWLDPDVWDSGSVPKPGASVTIAATHTVGLVPQGMSVEPVRLASLTVEGTLVSSWPIGMGGEPVIVETAYFACPAGGSVFGEDSFFGPGGSVHISYDDTWLPWGVKLDATAPAPWSFIGHGLIKGGDGLDGGDVVIDYAGGVFEHCGTMLGGDGTRGGSVRVIATHAENFQKGVIMGGAGGIGGGGSADLTVTTTATSGPAFLANLPGGIIKGGDSVGGPGGDAGLAAYDPFAKGADLIHEGLVAGEGPSLLLGGGGTAGGGDAWLCAPAATVFGIVAGGPDTDSGAPTTAEGDVTISTLGAVLAKECEVAGSLVTFRPEGALSLGPFSAKPAITADFMELEAAPGASVDLVSTVPFDFAVAGSTVAVSPFMLGLPAGTPLAALLPGVVGPVPPLTAPETRLATSSATIAFADELSPGAFDLRLDMHVGHFGTESAVLDVVLAAEPAFSLPTTTLATGSFAPGDDLRITADLTVAPVAPAPPLLFVELYSDGALIEIVELPLWLIPRKPSVELFGERDDQLSFQVPATFTPPLDPVGGELVITSATGPVAGFLILGVSFFDPAVTLVGMDFLVDPLASPLIPLGFSAEPTLPISITSASLAGFELCFQGVVYDPFAAPGSELRETNAAKLAFRP